MEVYTVKCLSDNFSYVVVDRSTNKAICIDPVEPQKIMDTVKNVNATLSMAMCTHKHADHTDGNEEIKKMNPGMKMYSTAYEPIPFCDVTLQDKETVKMGNITIQAFHTPCHTKGHEVFMMTSDVDPNQPPAIFTADTLFVGGCGRFFEGSGADMNYSLNKVCASFPHNSNVYCGHEYTKNNLRFAAYVEPDNVYIQAKQKWVDEQIAQNKPTVPSTIGDEMKHNPFMRVNQASVKMAVCGTTDVSDDECMTKLRQMKDSF